MTALIAHPPSLLQRRLPLSLTRARCLSAVVGRLGYTGALAVLGSAAPFFYGLGALGGLSLGVQVAFLPSWPWVATPEEKRLRGGAV